MTKTPSGQIWLTMSNTSDTSDIARQPPQSQEATVVSTAVKKRKCGICKNVGHDSWNCPQLPHTTTNKVTTNAAWTIQEHNLTTKNPSIPVLCFVFDLKTTGLNKNIDDIELSMQVVNANGTIRNSLFREQIKPTVPIGNLSLIDGITENDVVDK